MGGDGYALCAARRRAADRHGVRAVLPDRASGAAADRHGPDHVGPVPLQARRPAAQQRHARNSPTRYGVPEDGKYVITRDRRHLRDPQGGRGRPRLAARRRLSELPARAGGGAARGVRPGDRPARGERHRSHQDAGRGRADRALPHGRRRRPTRGWQTEVPGLLVAGEAVGGANGANRLSGNAITEALVFGREAGRSAAAARQGDARPCRSSRNAARAALDLHRAPTAPQDDAQHRRDDRSACKPSWPTTSARCAPQAKLERALGTHRRADARARRAPVRRRRAVRHAAARLVRPAQHAAWSRARSTQAALARTESRGAHQREDFPDMLPQWRVNQVIAAARRRHRHHAVARLAAAGRRAMSETATLKIWRGAETATPAAGRPTRCRSSRGQSVLDGLRWIRVNNDPSLAIRFSCINANACKECMMELDGETVYACTARLEPREMTLAPLSNKKLVRDLVTEIAPPAERFGMTCKGEMMTDRTQAGRLRRHARLDEGAESAPANCTRSTPRSTGTSSSAPSRGWRRAPAPARRCCSTTSRTTTRTTAAAAACSPAALGSYRRIAMMLGLPPDTHPRELVKIGRTILNGRIPPKIVKTGPCKENIVTGKDIDLYEFPVPHWNRLDGGRYLLTYGGVRHQGSRHRRDERRHLSRHGVGQGPHPDPDVARAAHRPPRHRLAERRHARRCRSRSRSAGSRRSASPAARRCPRASANTT